MVPKNHHRGSALQRPKPLGWCGVGDGSPGLDLRPFRLSCRLHNGAAISGKARFLELPLPDAAKRAILWDNCARDYMLT